MLIKFLLFIILIFTQAGKLKAQFTLDGEFRPRMEYRHGYQKLMAADERAAFFVSQRTRINLGLREENYSFGFSLQDIRVWGEVPQLNRSDINSAVHEAWAELRISPLAVIKAGRQEIIYDNSRIFGNVDWVQQGRSHDAALLKWDLEGDLRLHLGLAFNQEEERITGTFYNLNNYKTLQYLWINKVWESLTASFLFLNNGMQHNSVSTTFSQTTGVRAVYDPENISLSGSAYMQSGRDAAGRTLDAYYLSLQFDQRLNGEVTFTTGFELLSGTDDSDMQDPDYTTSHSFNPLYGTNHIFNGHMDYFYVGNHINNVGLRDIYGGLNYAPGVFSAGFRLHVFSSDALLDDPENPGETKPRYLGTELDLYLGFRLHENTFLRAGYSQLFASSSMEALKGGSRHESSNWAWLMLVIRPDFLNLMR